MIKAIIFDLGGVLITNGTETFIENISARHKLDKEFVRNIVDGEIGTGYRKGNITRDEYWKQVLANLNINEDINKLENEWIDGYELIEGTKDIVLELAKKYRVFYLSDNVRERVERLNEKFGFIKWFEDGTFAYEAGVRKPDMRIYELVIKKANVRPEEAAYVDDKESCVKTAAQMGIRAFLFETPEKLKSELKQKGIL